jgi:uncharacterized protein DUF732
MVCPYCGNDVGTADVCELCGTSTSGDGLTGWRPDLTVRYEGRYYVAGRPTGRVRNGRKQSYDPDGGRMLPAYIDLPPRSRTSIRSTWLATGAATVVIVLLAAVVWVLLLPHGKPASPDANYLSALNDSGLTHEFNSDANAVAHGRQVCRQLEDGGPQQGLAVDKFAVDAFCPQFAEGFHILETATVPGSFILIESTKGYYSSIEVDGDTCKGIEGYSDIGSGTQVTVKNGKGEILATTTLGEGHGNDVQCTFAFQFPITEGQDRYVVSVARRGDFSYSFQQLQQHGVEVHLGS